MTEELRSCIRMELLTQLWVWENQGILQTEIGTFHLWVPDLMNKCTSPLHQNFQKERYGH